MHGLLAGSQKSIGHGRGPVTGLDVHRSTKALWQQWRCQVGCPDTAQICLLTYRLMIIVWPFLR